MEKPEDKPRANWSNHIEFILTLIGFAVGLGNVWRFPYLCFRNGGGAFLIPYFICLLVMGIPLFYLELAFGQFASLGPLKIWAFNPAMKGLGFAMVIVSCLIAFYYNVVIAVCIHYFFASMKSELPWNRCDPEWSTCNCRDLSMNKSSPDPWEGARNSCLSTNITEDQETTPTEEYFSIRVLNQSGSLADGGTVSWELALCLLLAWLIVFLVLTKGIKSLGKVVYVTAILPYVLLTALLIRAATLPGHTEGVNFYLKPNLTKLTEASVWSDAAVQIFYSLSACSGGLIAMASYNNFNNNILRDTLLVPLINCLTSFYAGFVIFMSLGFMAHNKNVTVSDVAAGGPGLAFVAYPEALSQMPISPLWSILFFLMMMMLGFSSQFSIVETVLTGLLDEFSFLRKSKWLVVGFRFCACAFGFLMGLPMTCQAGFYLLDVVDTYVGGFPLLFVGFFEAVSINYIYGFFKFKKDIEMMLGKTMLTDISFFYFGPMWCFVTPACLLATIVFKAIQYTPKSAADDALPDWADSIGWLIALFPILTIFVWHIGYYCVCGGARVWCKLNTPKSKWGPALEENRDGYRYCMDHYHTQIGYPQTISKDMGYGGLDLKQGKEEMNGKVNNGTVNNAYEEEKSHM